MDFLKNLEKKANETFKKTKEKVTTVSEELKAKGKISDYKLEIEELYMEIGKKVFEEVKEGKDVIIEEIAEKIEKISKLQEKIEKTESEILTLKKMKKCINCGEEIYVDDVFCSYCGKRQIKRQENVEIYEEGNPHAQEAEVIQVKDVETQTYSATKVAENSGDTETKDVENSENVETQNVEYTENVDSAEGVEKQEKKQE